MRRGSPYNLALLNQSRFRSPWDNWHNFLLENAIWLKLVGLERRHLRLPQPKILDFDRPKFQSYSNRQVGHKINQKTLILQQLGHQVFQGRFDYFGKVNIFLIYSSRRIFWSFQISIWTNFIFRIFGPHQTSRINIGGF